MKNFYGRTFKIGLIFFAIWTLILFLGDRAMAEIIECDATSINDDTGQWSKEKMEKFKPGATVAYQKTISRCSYSVIEGKRTCDVYNVEYKHTTTFHSNGGKIYKFYYFIGQMDIQIFINILGEGTYIENNGRGTIHRGNCKIRYSVFPK